MDIDVSGVVLSGPELHESRRPELYGSIVFTYVLASVAVALRIVARRLVKTDLWIDDWVCLMAYITASAQFGLQMYGIWRGLGVHIISLLPTNSVNDAKLFFKILLAQDALYSLELMFIKASVVALYWRLFHPVRYMRLFIYIAGPIVVGLGIVFTVIIFTQCIPLEEFWNLDRLFNRASGDALCKVDEYGLYLSGAISQIATDVALVVAPLPAIWSISRPTSQKVPIVVMFLLGGLVCVISSVRLWKVVDMDYDTWDVTWSFVDLDIWTVVETHMALVCICLPTLRPILSLFSPRYRTSKMRSSGSY